MSGQPLMTTGMPEALPLPSIPGEGAQASESESAPKQPEVASQEPEHIRLEREARERAAKLKAMSPAERWQFLVKEADLSVAEANAILDEFFSKGYWEKSYELYGGRLKFTFRSRYMQASQRLSEEWDRSRTGDPRVLQQMQARFQLAHALHSYNGHVLPPLNGPNYTDLQRSEALTRRLEFLDNTIGELVGYTVVLKMNDFDRKLSAALSEEAASGF